jgi:hypothetical protein
MTPFLPLLPGAAPTAAPLSGGHPARVFQKVQDVLLGNFEKGRFDR